MRIRESYVRVNQYTRPAKKLTSIRGVVWHYTASPRASAQNIRDYFNGTCITKKRYASAHIAVDEKEAIVILPLNEVAYHAHDNSRCYPAELKPNANYNTIGVEMCVDGNNNITPKTFENAVELGVWLCQKYGFDPMKNFYRHYDITGKNCPAPWVRNPTEFERFKRVVKARLNGSSASTPAPSTSNLIRYGDRGQAVKDLQAKLNKAGFNCGAADGIFGAKTLQAVKKLQAKYGLKVDGIVGSQTRAALEKALSTQKYPLPQGVLKYGSRGTRVKQLQAALNASGFNCGAVDGIFGTKTLIALKNFQRAANIKVDGIYGNQTRTALDRRVNK